MSKCWSDNKGGNHMDVSIFLAKIIGLNFLIFGITLFFNKASFQSVLDDFIAHPALILFGGFVNLLLGSMIIISHNIWDSDWRVLITIIGWLLFIRGIIWLAIPRVMVKWISNMTRNLKPFYIATLVSFILGI